MHDQSEYADMSRRTVPPELRARIAEARRRYLQRKFPNLATDQDREIADSEEQWQAILRKAGR